MQGCLSHFDMLTFFAFVFEVNTDINSKVSLCLGDITNINIDAVMNAVKETLVSDRRY